MDCTNSIVFTCLEKLNELFTEKWQVVISQHASTHAVTPSAHDPSRQGQHENKSCWFRGLQDLRVGGIDLDVRVRWFRSVIFLHGNTRIKVSEIRSIPTTEPMINISRAPPLTKFMGLKENH